MMAGHTLKGIPIYWGSSLFVDTCSSCIVFTQHTQSPLVVYIVILNSFFHLPNFPHMAWMNQWDLVYKGTALACSGNHYEISSAHPVFESTSLQ